MVEDGDELLGVPEEGVELDDVFLVDFVGRV